MRMDVARSAIRRAKALGAPFRVALPTYGYRLFFDRNTGEFKRIAAENTVRGMDGMTERVIAPDLREVATLVGELMSGRTACTGVIWFRLPVPGDRLCVSRRAVAQLMKGAVPNSAITVERQISDTGAIEVYLTNEARLSCTDVRVELTWADIAGEFDLGNSFSTVGSKLPGVLPSVLRGRAPKPGERLFVGWFRTPSDNLSDTSCRESTE